MLENMNAKEESKYKAITKTPQWDVKNNGIPRM